jgi:putative Mg2+ transporter-C (MgtC) family protein
MSTTIDWTEIAIRLGLTLVAGVLIGFNRWEHGKGAGLRTTTLVGLAACVAMIQVNLLLPLAGRPSDSFVMNDLMRLPLGVLTGVGFIGGGAIMRRGDMVIGVTTAATLWLITVIGLCLGGVSWGWASRQRCWACWSFGDCGGLNWLSPLSTAPVSSSRWRRALRTEQDIWEKLKKAGFRVAATSMSRSQSGRGELKFDLRTFNDHRGGQPPALVAALASTPGVTTVAWHWNT